MLPLTSNTIASLTGPSVSALKPDDRPGLAAFHDDEVPLRKIRHEPALSIADDGRHGNQVDRRLETRSLGCFCGGIA